MPAVSLDQELYEELENNTLDVTIIRSEDFTLPLTVYLTLSPLSTDNATQAKGMEICLKIISSVYCHHLSANFNLVCNECEQLLRISFLRRESW